MDCQMLSAGLQYNIRMVVYGIATPSLTVMAHLHSILGVR